MQTVEGGDRSQLGPAVTANFGNFLLGESTCNSPCPWGRSELQVIKAPINTIPAIQTCHTRSRTVMLALISEMVYAYIARMGLSPVVQQDQLYC
jgi:hypothetical protein